MITTDSGLPLLHMGYHCHFSHRATFILWFVPVNIGKIKPCFLQRCIGAPSLVAFLGFSLREFHCKFVSGIFISSKIPGLSGFIFKRKMRRITLREMFRNDQTGAKRVRGASPSGGCEANSFLQPWASFTKGCLRVVSCSDTEIPVSR